MQTVEEIFVKLGGTGAVAKAIEVRHSTASEMRRRKSIPIKYWPALIKTAQDMGEKSVDTDLLVRVHIDAGVA